MQSYNPPMTRIHLRQPILPILRLRTGYPWLIPAPDEIKQLTELYLQETYSAHPITKDERTVAVKVWRKLFWRLLYARVIVRL